MNIAKFGKKVLEKVGELKRQSQFISGPITAVLHELEGKLFRATGVVQRRKRKSRKEAAARKRAKKVTEAQ